MSDSDLATYVVFHNGNMKHCSVVPLANGKLPNDLAAIAEYETVEDALRDFPKSAIVQLVTERTNLDALPTNQATNAERILKRARMGLLEKGDER